MAQGLELVLHNEFAQQPLDVIGVGVVESDDAAWGDERTPGEEVRADGGVPVIAIQP